MAITKMPEGRIREMVYGLRIKQALPLEDKVLLAQARIKDWHDHFNGGIVVDYSGGKDSMVLLHLVRELYPETPARFVNTGLEYPEVVKAARAAGNIVFLRPCKSFRRIVEDHGWPVASKQISEDVRFARNSPLATADNPRVAKLRNSRWAFLLRAPFKISPRCCYELKEKPLDKHKRESGLAPLIGTMASESRRRFFAYARVGGCNLYAGRSARSAPLSVWTQQDVLRYIQTRGLRPPSVYGELVEARGELRLTGRPRTGCMFCLFGLHMDGYPNRLELMAETHPAHYRLVMGKLGLEDVLRWLYNNAPPGFRPFYREPAPRRR